MNYHKDDGSFGSGIFIAVVILAAFICGYALRDSGFKVKVDRPAIEPVIKAPVGRV
jgi:hypothetical protein